MLTLILEASTIAGSVALLRGDDVVATREVAMGASREDALFPAVQAVLNDAQIEVQSLSAIVCGEGPGSFTSLRIAASIAKGLSQAVSIPLYAVPSLLLAAGTHNVPGDYVVHADALRGERYAMAVRIDVAGAVSATSGVSRLSAEALVLFAGGRTRLSVLGSESSTDDIAVRPAASCLMRVVDWRAHGRVDLASWEPAYGRLAEAQVKWEAAHHQTLAAVLRADVSARDDASISGAVA